MQEKPGERVAEPHLDARVLSAQRGSPGYAAVGLVQLPSTGPDSWTAHDRARTGRVRFWFTGKGNSNCQGASKATRRTDRRAARWRPEEMTVPGEKGVGVLLAESVQKVERPVSRELPPLPIPFLENEVVESKRMRGLSRPVRSRVERCVGWQGWANAGVRGMNEIFGKTATLEAGGRPSAMQLSSLSRICDAYRVKSAADCSSTAEAFEALCCSVPGYTGNGVKQATFKEGLVSPADPGAKNGRWFCSLDWLGLGSLEGLAPGFASFAKRAS